MIKKFTLLFLLLSSAILAFAQADRYQVFVEDMLVGQYALFEERNNYIETFASMRFTIAQFGDTSNYYSKQIFTEDTLGNLLSIDYQSAFKQDTTSYQVFFQNDTFSIESEIGQIKKTYEYVMGPSAIKTISLRNLDSLGKSICYPQFVPELGQILEVNRTIVDQSIEGAQRLWHVEETIAGFNKTTAKYNRNFDLIENMAESPFGKIIIRKADGYRPISNFQMDQNLKLRSNVRFPDPNNISKASLTVNIDTLTIRVDLPQGASTDSSYISQFIGREQWLSIDSAVFVKADSLISDSLSSSAKIELLKGYVSSSNQITYATKFAALARQFDIPTKVIFGYVYEEGNWISKYWNECWTGSNWQIVDQSSEKNEVLRYKPIDANKYTQLSQYLTKVAQVMNRVSIRVMSYNFQGRNYTINQSDLRQDVYQDNEYLNQGLGLKFELPDNYERKSGREESFAFFENSFGENLTLCQVNVIDDFGMRELILSSIGESTSLDRKDIEESSKNGFFTGHNNEFGAIAIPQGGSFILILIQSNEPKKLIDFLLKKNLKIDY